LGKLIGDADPADSASNWQAANSDLNKIRSLFKGKTMESFTFFMGAIIRLSAATEIYA
jgi:hypothetical protein